MSRPDSLIDVALFFFEHNLGKPYIWGGDDPILGFDCSGGMILALQSVGRLPSKGDWRAKDLAQQFPVITRLVPGALVFWNRGAEIGHVEMVYHVDARSGTILTVGAAGGGSKTMTVADAIRDNAMVRIQPVERGWVRAVDPFHDLR